MKKYDMISDLSEQTAKEVVRNEEKLERVFKHSFKALQISV